MESGLSVKTNEQSSIREMVQETSVRCLFFTTDNSMTLARERVQRFRSDLRLTSGVRIQALSTLHNRTSFWLGEGLDGATAFWFHKVFERGGGSFINDVTKIWRFSVPLCHAKMTWLFYLGLHTKHHKSGNPPTCVTSFMDNPRRY